MAVISLKKSPSKVLGSEVQAEYVGDSKGLTACSCGKRPAHACTSGRTTSLDCHEIADLILSFANAHSELVDLKSAVLSADTPSLLDAVLSSFLGQLVSCLLLLLTAVADLELL